MSVTDEDVSQSVESLSIAEFCHIAKELHETRPDLTSFIQFVLSGTLDGKQYCVDPILDPLLEAHSTRALRDYDSMLGIDEDILITNALTIWPISKFEDTLLKPVHLDYSIQQGETTHKVPLHRIPNLGLGKWKTHNLVRVMFPALWREDRSGRMSQQELSMFYEKGLRPAVLELEQEWAGDWPPSYAAELTRARGAGGQLALQSKMVGEWNISELGSSIRRHLAASNIDWGEGLFFLHQIKGVKGSSRHAHTSDSAEMSLEQFLTSNDLPIDRLKEGSWWIDVGLEISSRRGHCLQWRTDHHRHAVSHILSVNDERAQRVTQLGSSKYARDMVAHLPSVSGCRITPGRQAQGPHSARYLQLYTTDKSLTYKPSSNGSSLALLCKDVFNEEKCSNFTEGLQKIYVDAAEETPSHARMEVRVPLSQGALVLVDIDMTLLRSCLLSFSRVSWWSFRLYRLLACHYIFEWYNEGDPASRSRDEALLLICMLVWLVNSLNCTPDLRSASRSLLDAALPHTQRQGADPDVLAYPCRTSEYAADPDDSEDPEDTSLVRNTIPYIPYGAIFIREILMRPPYAVPQFTECDFSLSAKAFEVFFKVPRRDVRQKYLQPGVSTTVPGRVPNHARLTLPWTNPEPTSPAAIFNLRDLGFALEPLPNPPNGTPQHVEDIDNIDDALLLLWNNFIIDMLRKSPNPKSASGASHLKLSSGERERGTEEIFHCRKLSTYWRDCQWKIGTRKAWLETFDRLWPPKGHVLPSGAQHYRQCRYYVDWCALTARTADGVVLGMRQTLKERFNGLFWVPAALSDRMWPTKYDHNFQKSSGLDIKGAAPRIIINPKFKAEPIW